MIKLITNLHMKIKGAKRLSFSILFFAILFATMQVIGCNLSLKFGTTVHTSMREMLSALDTWMWLLIWLIEIVFFYFALFMLFWAIDRKERSCTLKRKVSRTGIMIGGTLGMLLCWLPVLLANLPGFFNYDISGQLIQVLYADLNTYNTHHSLISTLVMGGIITLGYEWFGTLYAGILMYSVFQMILCAITFAYSLDFIYRKTKSTGWLIFGFLFYAFSPTISMFAMSTTKDVICSLCLLLTILFVFEMFEDGSKFFKSPVKIIVLVVLMILAALFRKNIIYAIVLFAVLCVALGGSTKGKMTLLFLGTVVGFFVFSFALEKGLEAEKGGKAEAYSIPIQQIGFLYNEEEKNAFTDEELKFLEGMLPAKQWKKYNPFSSDDLKNFINTEYFVENKKEFLSLWIKKGIQYPFEYIEAFCNLTYQAWYPGTSIYEGDIYYFDFHGANYMIEKTSYIPGLTKFCEKISLDFYYQKVPVIRLLFSVGFMFWSLLITLCRGIYKKRKAVVGSGLLALCVCLSCMAGPVSLVRYYLILFYAFPVYLAMLFYGRKLTEC